MSDVKLEYTPALFAQNVRDSGYRLPALAQAHLRQARHIRLEKPSGTADASLVAIMDTVEKGAFIPDDWISMFGLLLDKLSFKDYGDLMMKIFVPFIDWSEPKPSEIPTSNHRTPVTPAKSATVVGIVSQPLFLPSPSTSVATPGPDRKRDQPNSPHAEIRNAKRFKCSDENCPPPKRPSGLRTLCNTTVVGSHLSLFAATGKDLDTCPEAVREGRSTSKSMSSDNLQPFVTPSFQLIPAVWSVSPLSPLAPQTAQFEPVLKSASINTPVATSEPDIPRMPNSRSSSSPPTSTTQSGPHSKPGPSILRGSLSNHVSLKLVASSKVPVLGASVVPGRLIMSERYDASTAPVVPGAPHHSSKPAIDQNHIGSDPSSAAVKTDIDHWLERPASADHLVSGTSEATKGKPKAEPQLANVQPSHPGGDQF
ncbi:hypothetical protein H0H87_003497 [Tephrocybe sp. NHM501043]|nr:hypothetical protein H0H87_003497 [Tephrocybe sp. NHM501043]